MNKQHNNQTPKSYFGTQEQLKRGAAACFGWDPRTKPDSEEMHRPEGSGGGAPQGSVLAAG